MVQAPIFHVNGDDPGGGPSISARHGVANTVMEFGGDVDY